MQKKPVYRIHQAHYVNGIPFGYSDDYDYEAAVAEHADDVLGADWDWQDYAFGSPEDAAAYLERHGYERDGLTFVRQLHPRPGLDVLVALIEPCGWAFE